MKQQCSRGGSTRGAALVAAVAPLIFLAGCAHYGAARIQSVPPGAEVVNLGDDTVLGVTPVEVWWRGDSDRPKFVNVRFRKDGYRSKVTAFWVNLRHGSREAAMEDPQIVNVELQQEEH